MRSTVSNALVKSKRIPTVNSFLSNDFNTLSVTSNIAILKLCCVDERMSLS